MVKVIIKRLKRDFALSNRVIKRIVNKTLKSQHINEGEISILFTGDAKIKQFNRKYLNKKRPTDVLAFSMQEGKPLKGSEKILGDVLVSIDRAKAQAKRFNTTIKKELALYIIHGVLHLTGYKDNSKKMKKLQQEILNSFFGQN